MLRVPLSTTHFRPPAAHFQPARAGGTDAFAAKLNPQGSAVVWATYLGGKGDDAAHAISLDTAGNVWLAGTNGSPDFPNQIGWSQGGDFLTGLNAAGSTLIYSSRLPDDTAAASLAVDAAGVAHLAGYGGLVSTLTTAQGGCGCPRIFGLANAAFGPAGGRLVAGEVFSIYGPRLGPNIPVSAVPDATGTMPKYLDGVQVSINGTLVPLLYVSDTQVNAVAPLFLSGATARVRVNRNGIDIPDFVATVVAASPEIFQRPDGTAAAVNQDGTLNSPEHPAQPGSIVAIWATGIGSIPFGSVWQDGQIAQRASDFGCCQIFAQAPANVLYGGAAPGIVAGVAQVNFQVPAQLTYYGPTLYLSLTAAGITSHSVQIYIAAPD